MSMTCPLASTIARPLGHRLRERYQNSANRRFLRFSVCPFPEGEGLQGEVEPLQGWRGRGMLEKRSKMDDVI